MTIPVATVQPAEPRPQPEPASPEAYKNATCPLCHGPLQKRNAGMWCGRDRGWLKVELRSGLPVHVLWQGNL